jgi:hypothetical protein
MKRKDEDEEKRKQEEMKEVIRQSYQFCCGF